MLNLLSSVCNYPGVDEIDSRQVSKCQRDFSQPVSLSFPLMGVQSSSGGTGALCIYAGLNGGRVVEEVPICGPEIKRPSANEVNGARGGEGGGGCSPVQSGMILDILDVYAKRRDSDGHAIARQRSVAPRLIIPLLARNASGRLIASDVDRCTRARYPRDM